MANIKIMALGGLGENGKNMYVVEVDELLFILDAGLRYPDIDMYGVDAVVPNLDYLIERKDKIAGIFVSHGHEDNIGAIPYLLRNIEANVYGTHFTISLIEALLQENKMDIKKYKLYRINENKTLSFKSVKVKFFNISHSLPEAVGISLHTKDGVIVYATDFNFMPSNDPHYSTSFDKITELKKSKVLALLAESVGTSAISRISNDMLLEHNYNNILTHSKNRIIVAAYSSDLIRIQKIIDLSLAYGRRVAIVGEKSGRVVKTAINSNYINLPTEYKVDLPVISEENLNDDKDLVVIVHGQREDAYSNLLRMAFGEDKYIKLTNDDKVIIMCPPVSGTEKFVNDAINTLYRYDLDIEIFDRSILRSSHASRDDLKLLFTMIKPKYIIPIKGEYRHMYEEYLIAKDSGYDKEHVILADNGEIINFVDGEIKESTKISVGDIFVDGSLIGDVNLDVIKDRETLANEGAVIINIYYDARLRKLSSDPIIVTKGLVGKMEDEELSKKICDLSKSIFENSLWKKNYTLENTENTISEEITKLIFRGTKHKPLVIVVPIEVSNVKSKTKE